MSEGADLGVGQTGQQGYHVVHHVLVVDDAVLTLPDKHLHKLAVVRLELLVHGAGHDQRVVTTLLQTESESN